MFHSVITAHSVMAGLVPAIHAFPFGKKDVDARDKPAHDDGQSKFRSRLVMAGLVPAIHAFKLGTWLAGLCTS